MARAASEIVVEAPLRQVYNQWTQFEEFPRFMENVEQVQQLDDRRLHWSGTPRSRNRSRTTRSSGSHWAAR